MKQVTITLPDDLDQAFEAFRRDQACQPDLAELVEVALREYLAGRGYLLRACTRRAVSGARAA